MNPVSVLRGLGPVDLRNIVRDPLLRWFMVLPLGVVLLVRWLMPALMVRLSGLIGFDLTAHFNPLMSGILLLLAPEMAGIVVGFMLLDQRDDGTLAALQVTPLSLEVYLLYRLAIPMLAGSAMTILLFPLAGLPQVVPSALVLGSLTAAPMAPLFALFLATFAGNKVQGFALMKASGVVLWPALVAYFAPMPWQLLAGVVPPYWAAKLYWDALAGKPGYWIWLPAGLIWQGLLLLLLLRRYRRIIRS